MSECIEVASTSALLNHLSRSCKLIQTGSRLIESKLFKAGSRILWQDNRDQIIWSSVAWLISSKNRFLAKYGKINCCQCCQQILVTLFDCNVKVVEKYKFRKITFNCGARKSSFCKTYSLGHNCLDCRSFWGLLACFLYYWFIFHEH